MATISQRSPKDLPKMTPEDATNGKGTHKESYSRPRFKNDLTQWLPPKNHASSISTMIGGSSNWWIGGLERVHSSESASTTFTISSSPSLVGIAVLLKRWAVATTAARGATALKTGLSAKGATFDYACIAQGAVRATDCAKRASDRGTRQRRAGITQPV